MWSDQRRLIGEPRKLISVLNAIRRTPFAEIHLCIGSATFSQSGLENIQGAEVLLSQRHIWRRREAAAH